MGAHGMSTCTVSQKEKIQGVSENRPDISDRSAHRPRQRGRGKGGGGGELSVKGSSNKKIFSRTTRKGARKGGEKRGQPIKNSGIGYHYWRSRQVREIDSDNRRVSGISQRGGKWVRPGATTDWGTPPDAQEGELKTHPVEGRENRGERRVC